MRFRNKLAAASAFAVLITPAAFAQDPPPAEEVEVVGVRDVGADHVGEEITVGGRALDVRMVRGTGVRISFLSGFLALIPETHVHLWKELDPVKRYEGRNPANHRRGHAGERSAFHRRHRTGPGEGRAAPPPPAALTRPEPRSPNPGSPNPVRPTQRGKLRPGRNPARESESAAPGGCRRSGGRSLPSLR